MVRISRQFKDFIEAYAVIANVVKITWKESLAVTSFCVAIEYQPEVGDKYHGVTIETARKRFYKDLRERVSPEAMMALDRGYTKYMEKVNESRKARQ